MICVLVINLSALFLSIHDNNDCNASSALVLLFNSYGSHCVMNRFWLSMDGSSFVFTPSQYKLSMVRSEVVPTGITDQPADILDEDALIALITSVDAPTPE